MARVVGIELQDAGWAPTRIIIVQLERLGYEVDEARYPLGRTILIIR